MGAMSVNADIARLLAEMAEMMEVLGENRFRVAALERAARVIAGLGQDLGSLAEDRSALTAIDGVGEKIANKIQEFVRTGRITEHDEYAAKIPAGLLDVLRLPGLGPKTVGILWREKGVESIADLERIITDGSILDLPRMGEKAVGKISAAIAFARTSHGRTPLGRAAPVVSRIIERLGKAPGVQRVVCAGSFRRGRDTVGDLDILASGEDAESIGAAFRDSAGVTGVLAAGATKSSVRMALDPDKPDRRIQVDLRVVPDEAFGAALLYFTGSKDHNVRLRERAIERGMTLNEYGLFRHDDRAMKQPPQERGVTPIASKTEADIYAALGLPELPPEIREDRGELALERAPALIELGDIRAELHAHTTASDGKLSIEELAREAKRRGFHTIAVTDHSGSQTIAHGLSSERLRAHVAAIHEANAKIKGIAILAGAEVDILADGSLDYDDDTLALLDVVVASPHWALTQKPGPATTRLLRAIEHPLVDIIGHPTGRLIGKREGLSPAMDELAAAAAEHDTALEINAHWMRLDLRDAHVRVAVDAGAWLAIDCDVHAASDFDNLRFGVTTGRRGWLTADRCVNTWTARRLTTWLKKRRR